MPTPSRRTILTLAGAAGALQPLRLLAQADKEKVWSQFLAWLKTIPPSDNPGNLIRDYYAHLVKTGAANANEQPAIIMEMMRTRDDGWQQIFNKIYTASSPGFSVRPNALLMSAVENRKPGRALDVGMGQGRNAVFLAIRGWDVTGFDVSDEGLVIARKNAAAAGVKLHAVQTSEAKFDYGTAQWDLIVIAYEPFPVADPRYIVRLSNALRPGGLLVVESFASDRSAAMRKPVDIDPAELLRAVESFRVLHFEDVEAVPDWDPAKTRLARLIAQKK